MKLGYKTAGHGEHYVIALHGWFGDHSCFDPLLDSLSQTACGFISPAAVAKFGADISKNPIGTGFMKFVNYSPKEKIEFVKNPDYNWAPSIWGHQGPAYLDKYTVVVADDPASRVTALESGDANAIEIGDRRQGHAEGQDPITDASPPSTWRVGLEIVAHVAQSGH